MAIRPRENLLQCFPNQFKIHDLVFVCLGGHSVYLVMNLHAVGCQIMLEYFIQGSFISDRKAVIV